MVRLTYPCRRIQPPPHVLLEARLCGIQTLLIGVLLGVKLGKHVLDVDAGATFELPALGGIVRMFRKGKRECDEGTPGESSEPSMKHFVWKKGATYRRIVDDGEAGHVAAMLEGPEVKYPSYCRALGSRFKTVTGAAVIAL